MGIMESKYRSGKIVQTKRIEPDKYKPQLNNNNTAGIERVKHDDEDKDDEDEDDKEHIKDDKQYELVHFYKKGEHQPRDKLVNDPLGKLVVSTKGNRLLASLV